MNLYAIVFCMIVLSCAVLPIIGILAPNQYKCYILLGWVCLIIIAYCMIVHGHHMTHEKIRNESKGDYKIMSIQEIKEWNKKMKIN